MQHLTQPHFKFTHPFVCHCCHCQNVIRGGAHSWHCQTLSWELQSPRCLATGGKRNRFFFLKKEQNQALRSQPTSLPIMLGGKKMPHCCQRYGRQNQHCLQQQCQVSAHTQPVIFLPSFILHCTNSATHLRVREELNTNISSLLQSWEFWKDCFYRSLLLYSY